MPEFKILNPKDQKIFNINFETFLALTKGSSIVNISHSTRSLHLQMSHGLSLILEAVDNKLEALISPSPQLNDFAPSARIVLLRNGEEPLAYLIEYRLWHVRQAYAIVCLLEENLVDEKSNILRDFHRGDLEELLPEEDRLYIIGAGNSSFLLDIAQKGYKRIKEAPQTALNIISLIYSEGRELVLRQVRAGTKLKELDVELKQLEVQEKKDSIQQKKIETVITVSNQISAIKDRTTREILRKRFFESLEESLEPKEIESYRNILLPSKK